MQGIHRRYDTIRARAGRWWGDGVDCGRQSVMTAHHHHEYSVPSLLSPGSDGFIEQADARWSGGITPSCVDGQQLSLAPCKTATTVESHIGFLGRLAERAPVALTSRRTQYIYTDKPGDRRKGHGANRHKSGRFVKNSFPKLFDMTPPDSGDDARTRTVSTVRVFERETSDLPWDWQS